MHVRAVIFDMDGTILNTLDDLRDSINHALEKNGHRHDYPSGTVRSFFGSGAEVAVARALALERGAAPGSLEKIGMPGDPTLQALRPEVQPVLAEFRRWYPAHCENLTRPYPGIPELLRTLRGRGMLVAVVSNKLDAAVQALCQRHFSGLVDAALGEREPEIRRKPAPDMTCAALRALDTAQSEAVYVGDSEIDLLTAENARLACVAVTWGFRDRAFLVAHGARHVADDAAALERMLCSGLGG